METTLSGVPRSLFRLESSDEAQSLPVTGFKDTGLMSTDYVENEVYILVEDYAVRFGFEGVDPVQASEGVDAVGLKVEPGGTIRVCGRHGVRTLRFISEVSGEPGVLQVLGVCN